MQKLLEPELLELQKMQKNAGIRTAGTAGTAIEKSWNRPCLMIIKDLCASHTGRSSHWPSLILAKWPAGMRVILYLNIVLLFK